MAGVDSPEAQDALTVAIKDWFPPNVGMIVTSHLHDRCRTMHTVHTCRTALPAAVSHFRMHDAIFSLQHRPLPKV